MDDTIPPCEWCGKPRQFHGCYRFPSQLRKRRFCSHWCAAQWKNREKRRTLTCQTCGKEFVVAQSYRTGARTFCSQACYLVAHAAKVHTCPTCGKLFAPMQHKRKYCSRACQPTQGEDNPNFGKRRPGLHQHSAEFRMRMSEARRGEGNPNWAGGVTPYRYRFQTRVSRWALANLPSTCAICGGAGETAHHIVARIRFADQAMPHFRQNLVILCRACHCSADHQARKAFRERRIRAIPFADRLPESILDQLEQDGSVSRLAQECDYTPLGNIAELAILPEWFSDTAE